MKKFFVASLFVMICLTMNSMVTEKTDNPFVSDETIMSVVKKLKSTAEAGQSDRIERGVRQAAYFWTAEDGSESDFALLCETYSAVTAIAREEMFLRMQDNLELILGSFNKISVGFKIPLHVDKGEILPIDRIFGGFSPESHFNDDMFTNQIAFITVLNFPFYSLQEKTANANTWSRLDWAYARMGDLFKSRIPADVLQQYAQVVSDAEAYIADYNVYMGNLIGKKGDKAFPEDMKLITHWGLRDELKSNYAQKDGLDKQATIYEVMLRIVNQEIPLEVINKNDYTWNPFTNKIFSGEKEVLFEMETNRRYQQLLNLFHATQGIDRFSPHFPDYIQRKFNDEMEIPVADIEKIFIEVLQSNEFKEVGKVIANRLGRKLQPWDIWYDGFKTRSTLDINLINSTLKSKYPNKEAFESDLPNILGKFGFNADSTYSIASKIIVDPSRGAGHAWGAMMKSDKARLRTRIGADGMDYKGYNIAVHEFGHNVEQTISLHDVDYYMLNGVPNTSFTEALAFVFQARDLELLGMEQKNEMKQHLDALDNLWSNAEIMGVSLVDINVWRWMYAHPDATADELKQAVVQIATETWNTYFAPVFGIKDSPILAIYSHMIDSPLYLSAYPIGQLIEFQFGNYISDKDFATEIYRAFRQGRIIPQLWMKGAVGSEISAKPAIKAAAEAIIVVNKSK
ncbi:MAG: hypothetical protein HOO86_00095 [Bacteroidales bacterium]|nr:hypothetical protein [Bacteroidales bacterium]